MRKSNKILGVVTAAAIAVSNLSMVVAPFTGIIAQAAVVPGAWTANTANVELDSTAKVTVNAKYTATGTATANDWNTEYTNDETVLTTAVANSAFSSAISVGTVVAVDGSDGATNASLTVPITLDPTKVTGAKEGDIITVLISYDDATDQFSGTASFEYVAPTLANVAAIGLVDDQDDNATDNIYTFYDGGAIDIEIGTRTSAGITTLTPDVELDYATTGVANANVGEFFLSAETSDDLIVTNPVPGTAVNKIGLTAVKNGTGTLTVKLKRVKTAGQITDAETVATTTVKVQVKGTVSTIGILDSKNKNISNTTQELSKTEKTFALTPSLTETTAKIAYEDDVIWYSDDETVLTVSGDKNGATVTAVGNTAGTGIYAIPDTGATYRGVYYAAIAAGAKPADAKDIAILAAIAGAQGVDYEVVTFTSEAFDVVLTPSVKSLDLIQDGEDSAAVTFTVNDDSIITITEGTAASLTNMKVEAKSDTESVATVAVADVAGTANLVVTPKKAGKANVTVTGTYQITGKSGLEKATVTAVIPVNVIDPKAQATAEEKAAAAEEAQKKAEAEATAAKADAAAQKTAAETATKEAAAAKEAATKAAAAQKAAEDAAAAAEKKAADAAAAATGIKKGATKAVKGQTFKATSSKAVTLTKIKNAKTVTVGSVVEINNQVYKVTALGKGALKAGKATKLTVDAQFLTKKGINADCAKGTGKIKTLIIKNQTKKAAPAKALVKAVKKYNKKVKVQYK